MNETYNTYEGWTLDESGYRHDSCRVGYGFNMVPKYYESWDQLIKEHECSDA